MSERQTIYGRFFGKPPYRAAVLAVVNEFERDGETFGDWAAYIGAIPAEDEPEEWSGTIGIDIPDSGPLRVVRDYGSKVPEAAALAYFWFIPTRHPAVRWRE